MEIIYFLMATVFLIVFIIMYSYNKAQLGAGFIFLLFWATLSLLLSPLATKTGNLLLAIPTHMLTLLYIVVLLLGVYGYIAFLLLQARAGFRRAQPSWAGRITTVLLLCYAAFMAVLLFVRPQTSTAVFLLWAGCLGIAVFYIYVLSSYLLSMLLVNLARPRHNQHYIIVLGSGLVNNELSLLALRMDKAIKFYQRQAKHSTPPKLVLCGGAGPGEPRPQADAMRNYAMERGIPAEHILMESHSTCTAESFHYAKQLMEYDAGHWRYRCIYVTGGYHLLQAGMLARREGLRIKGLGTRISLRHLPKALLGELWAIALLKKGSFIRLAILGLVLGIGLGLLFLQIYP